MIEVVGPVHVGIQMMLEQVGRPEDCSYGRLSVPSIAHVPAVGDRVAIDTDPEEPLGQMVVVLTRLFSYMSIEDAKPGKARTGELYVNLVCRPATEQEELRAIKE